MAYLFKLNLNFIISDPLYTICFGMCAKAMIVNLGGKFSIYYINDFDRYLLNFFYEKLSIIAAPLLYQISKFAFNVI